MTSLDQAKQRLDNLLKRKDNPLEVTVIEIYHVEGDERRLVETYELTPAGIIHTVTGAKMSDTNSSFVVSALHRLGHYSSDLFLREYVKLGALVVEAHAARTGQELPGNFDELKAMADACQKEQEK